MRTHTYPTAHKLKQKKAITLLFEKGKWRSYGNLRVISLRSEAFTERKIAVSVSKKYFKRAVDRNRIKRLLRESYRLNQQLYLETFGEKSIAMLFYTSSDLPKDFKAVEADFINLCTFLKKI